VNLPQIASIYNRLDQPFGAKAKTGVKRKQKEPNEGERSETKGNGAKRKKNQMKANGAERKQTESNESKRSGTKAKSNESKIKRKQNQTQAKSNESKLKRNQKESKERERSGTKANGAAPYFVSHIFLSISPISRHSLRAVQYIYCSFSK
jgi:hypothetical protein